MFFHLSPQWTDLLHDDLVVILRVSPCPSSLFFIRASKTAQDKGMQINDGIRAVHGAMADSARPI